MTTRTRSNEAGYVLPTTALLLVPLLVFAAFAVDVGSWYTKAAQTQRAADAAALAAVVRMPNNPAAVAAALDEAARNGFVDQPGCDPPTTTAACLASLTAAGSTVAYPQVVVTGLNDQAVRVNIYTEGEVFFGGAVIDDGPTIERYASAQYILPVPMGNPTSALGTGNRAQAGTPQEGIWLAVNGYCTGRQQGDQISGGFRGTNFGTCPSGGANPQYQEEGYYLVLDMPANSNTVTWAVQFYEPGACADNQSGRTRNEYNAFSQTPVRLETTLYRADGTQFDDSDNITAANRLAPLATAPGSISSNRLLFNANAGCNPRTWQTAFNIDPAQPRGRWLLNYRSLQVSGERDLNYFSVRVVPTSGPGAFNACSTLGGANLDTCPRVYAKDRLPVYALGFDTDDNAIFEDAGGNDIPAAFYLAEIAEVHAGKTLEIELFDPGEGMDNIQVIAPDLSRYPFSWETVDCQEYAVCGSSNSDNNLATNGESGTQNTCTTAVDPATVPAAFQTTVTAGSYNCLRVSGASSPFQNKTVRIEVGIPSSYSCTTNCWWRIRYEPGSTGTVTDRTVWSVRVIGDPVRLTE